MNVIQIKDVIGIDEGQFFEDLVESCEFLANNGKIVIVTGLNGNFRREPFDQIVKLIPKCEKIRYLESICFFCKKPAHFSLRTVENESEIFIGGAEAYRSACRECYFLNNKSVKV